MRHVVLVDYRSPEHEEAGRDIDAVQRSAEQILFGRHFFFLFLSLPSGEGGGEGGRGEGDGEWRGGEEGVRTRRTRKTRTRRMRKTRRTRRTRTGRDYVASLNVFFIPFRAIGLGSGVPAPGCFRARGRANISTEDTCSHLPSPSAPRIAQPVATPPHLRE